jgi:hypothetical protein
MRNINPSHSSKGTGSQVERHEVHDKRLDIRKGAEVILPHIHHMVDL